MKFKGKGHEVSDLNRLMQSMEHWGNRLFPKMTFDEVIERVEKLGRKSAVQVRLSPLDYEAGVAIGCFLGPVLAQIHLGTPIL